MRVGDEYPCGQAAGSADHTRLGTFDIQTMAPSLAGLEEAEQHEMDDRVALSKRFPDGVVPADVMSAHRTKHDLYLRVRAHEKAHFYQAISTSGCLGRTFAVNDLRHNLFTVLENVPREHEIWLPLLRWALSANPGVPELLTYVHTFRIADIINAALDGDPDAVDHHPRWTRPFFTGSDGPITSDMRFRLGQRYLAEGSAKAAEWIYILRADPQAVTRAELDLESSPEVYRRALTYLRGLIPNIPLLGQLQALVLATDFALHPLFPVGLWPDMFNAEAGNAPYLAPGPRFVAVAELLPLITPAAFLDKKALAAELVSSTQQVLGWPHPDEVTRAVTASINEVLARPLLAEGLENLKGDLHPVRRMRTALEVRLADTFSFVPPINAPLINEHQSVIPSGFLGSLHDPLNEVDRVLFSATWFASRLASQLVYARCPECPIRADDRYLAEFARGSPGTPGRPRRSRFWHRLGHRVPGPGRHQDGRAREDEACAELTSGRCRKAQENSAVRHEFLSCKMIDKNLSECLGAEWRSRIRFFVSTDPVPHRLAPERPAVD
jgi:hypothetical protein